jgi:hypothetical protein
MCLLALAGVDIRLGTGAAMLDLAYNHGLYDMSYTALGRRLRTRTLSFMVGYSLVLRPLP